MLLLDHAKCPKCGDTFQVETVTCPTCNTGTIQPDTTQRDTAKAFFARPNRDNETQDIIKSVLKFLLAVDDYFLSVQYADVAAKKPAAIYVEDSRYMRICADKYGILGNGEWFCPKCTIDDPEDVYDELSRNKHRYCRIHADTPLKETAYICWQNGKVTARFSKEEIVHGRSEVWLPELYGHSKVISCLRILLSLTAMDKWGYDIYTNGFLSNVAVFPGMTQPDVNDLMQEVKKQTSALNPQGNVAENATPKALS